MLEELKQEVLEANKRLKTEKLVVMTWGNVSGRDPRSGLVAIKASGVEYDAMTLDDVVVVDLEGEIVEGSRRPSTDLDTHLELYRHFDGIGGVVHTHSHYATIWAQAGEGIPCYGTTHADYFPSTIPVTRPMTAAEINGEYEKNTGTVIVETFQEINPLRMRAVLVSGHGPFVWGRSASDALHIASVLETVAFMALHTRALLGAKEPFVSKELLAKHYERKFGPNAYYGQGTWDKAK